MQRISNHCARSVFPPPRYPRRDAPNRQRRSAIPFMPQACASRAETARPRRPASPHGRGLTAFPSSGCDARERNRGVPMRVVEAGGLTYVPSGTVREAVFAHRAQIASRRPWTRVAQMPKYGEVDMAALNAAVNAVRAHLTVDIPGGSRYESVNGWPGRGGLHQVTVGLVERKTPGKAPLAAGRGKGEHRAGVRGR